MAAKPELRRSQRLGTYDSNGRDYLSATLGWNRSKFEEWIYSTTVRPHLQDWYMLCITNRECFNDAVDWINAGEKGYFYNESYLEEDLLFICLHAGNDGVIEKSGQGGNIDFVNFNSTTNWNTHELWARAAWRVAQDNRGAGQIFHSAMKDQPAAAYGFAIEILCIIFHSVAFRGAGSVYLPLLKGGSTITAAENPPAESPESGSIVDLEDDLMNDDFTASSSGTADRYSDDTFTDTERERADSELSTIVLARNNPEAARDAIDTGSIIQVVAYNSGTSADPNPQTADKASNEIKHPQELLTPESSPSLQGTVLQDGGQNPNDKRVREWLGGSM